MSRDPAISAILSDLAAINARAAMIEARALETLRMGRPSPARRRLGQPCVLPPARAGHRSGGGALPFPTTQSVFLLELPPWKTLAGGALHLSAVPAGAFPGKRP